jgi:phosphatidylglycerol:prolipoprotein diacylglycerol transferase
MININIDPVAFWNVRWYGIMVALGILVLILWAVWQVRRGAKLTNDTVFTAALVGIPSGIVFSRLLHVVDLWGYYSQHPGEIIGGSGLTIYGAVLGTALGIWVYSKFAKIRYGYLADVITPGIILAQAIGRVGCTINGCCYGTETTLPWAIIYNHPNALAPLGVATHPVVVYEIIYLMIIFGVVLALRNRLKPDGSLFMVYLSLYSVWRLGIDFLRVGTSFVFGLHEAQVIGIITLAIIIPVLILRTRMVKAEALIPIDEQTPTGRPTPLM